MTNAAASPIKVIRVGNCSSLSGKSSLAYQVGYDSKSQIHLRIASNSGGGWFSGDWVSLQTILSALNDAPKPLTSYALQALFKGKSVNTPAFLFAALKQEGLVESDPDNPRCYISLPANTFISNLQLLIDAGTDLKQDVEVTGKGVIKGKRSPDIIPVMTASSKPKSKKIKPEVHKP